MGAAILNFIGRVAGILTQLFVIFAFRACLSLYYFQMKKSNRSANASFGYKVSDKIRSLIGSNESTGTTATFFYGEIAGFSWQVR